MIRRTLLLACALALLTAGCDRSPTDPSRPDTYEVVFIGVPADARTFTPRAVAGGRVVGTASDGENTWAVQWANGTFTRLGPAAPAGCHTEPLAARTTFVVGHVTCTASGDPAGQPVDVYGWSADNAAGAGRLFAEPYTFVSVNRTGDVAGTIYPSAQFPQAPHRAFVRMGGGVAVLVPPDASASEAAGITDAGSVVVTAWFTCLPEAENCLTSRVMVWTAGVWTEIRPPRGATRLVAGAVSPAGHVAVYAFGETDEVFVYHVPRRDRDALPVIPGTRVVLVSANALGQVVGTGIRPAETSRAASYGIVWGDERQYDLSERIVGLARWQINTALATDDEGRIAGTGTNVEGGQDGPILLIPTDL